MDNINLHFEINEDYLLSHTLGSTSKKRHFSSNEYTDDIVAFQNFAWDKSESLYDFLIGRSSPLANFSNDVKKVPKYVNDLKSCDEFKKILNQTESYLSVCKKQWSGNYKASFGIIGDLTGLKLGKEFVVYITHPSLRNGSYHGDNIISWGCTGKWPNYDTVYIWHEILHSYFVPTTEVNHALIEMITDNELRIRLNGGKYPPFVGHDFLPEVRNKVFPYWKEYLKRAEKDILIFEKEMERKLKVQDRHARQARSL